MRLFRTKSVMRVWALAYIIMIIAVICCNIYITVSANKRLRAEMESSSKYYMRNIIISMDNTFSEMDIMRNSIVNSADIQDFSKIESLNDGVRLKAAGITDRLKSISNNHSMITSFMCYFPKSRTVVTPNMFFESSAYYNMISSDSDKYDEWKDSMERREYRAERVALDNWDSADTVVVNVPITDENSNLKFTIVFYLNKLTLFRTVDKDETLIVLKSDGKQIFSSDDKEYDFSNIWLKKSNESKIESIDINGKNKYIYYVRSDKYTYRYVQLMDRNNFMSESLKMLFIALASGLLCVIFSIIIMLYTIKWNYKKIKGIIGDEDLSVLDKEDEYAIIKNKIDAYLEQNNELNRRINNQMGMVKDSFITNYIKGFVGYGDIKEYVEIYNILPYDENFLTVAIHIKNYGILSDKDQSQSVFAVNNIIRDILGDINYIFTETDNVPLYIISCEDGLTNSRYKIVEAFEEVKSLAYDILQIEFAVGISSVIRGFANVPKICNEAKEALEYARFYDLYDFVYYDDMIKLSSCTNETNDNFNRIKNEIVVYISGGKKEEADEIIDNIFTYSAESRLDDKAKYIDFMYSIMNAFIAYSLKNLPENYDKVLNLTKSIGEKVSFPEIKKILKNAVDIMCAKTPVAENDFRINDNYSRTKAYVDEHFADTDISVTSISDAVGLSPYYISKLFKQYNGTKLPTYINDLRIEYAKGLLVSDRSLNVSDVAVKSGYENTRTFLKLFKEKTGLTPTQFRNIN